MDIKAKPDRFLLTQDTSEEPRDHLKTLNNDNRAIDLSNIKVKDFKIQTKSVNNAANKQRLMVPPGPQKD